MTDRKEFVGRYVGRLPFPESGEASGFMHLRNIVEKSPILRKPKAARRRYTTITGVSDHRRAVDGRALQLDGREGALIIVTRERLQLRHITAVVP